MHSPIKAKENSENFFFFVAIFIFSLKKSKKKKKIKNCLDLCRFFFRQHLWFFMDNTFDPSKPFGLTWISTQSKNCNFIISFRPNEALRSSWVSQQDQKKKKKNCHVFYFSRDLANRWAWKIVLRNGIEGRQQLKVCITSLYRQRKKICDDWIIGHQSINEVYFINLCL